MGFFVPQPPPTLIHHLPSLVMKKIGIIASYELDDANKVNRVSFEYVQAIKRTGRAIPYIIPCNDTHMLDYYIRDCDAFVVPGGHDVDPSIYGDPLGGSVECSIEDDRIALDFIGRVVASGKPLLGICRGMQLINVFFGGKLQQHLESADLHDQYERQYEHIHDVRVAEDSFLFEALGIRTAPVNSLHHQAISVLGRDLRIVAESTDDHVPEAIVHTGGRPIYGVQWHPERIDGYDGLFDWFVRREPYGAVQYSGRVRWLISSCKPMRFLYNRVH